VKILFAIAGILWLSVIPAQADVLSGSFSGVASSGSYPRNNPFSPVVDLTGSPITGTFNVTSLVGASPTYVGTGISYTTFAAGSINLTFYIASVGQTYSSYDLYPLIALEDDGKLQTIRLQPGGLTFSDVLEITGPEGSLFDSIADISSLHAGTGATVVSARTNFNTRELTPTVVTIQSQSINGQPIPEPASGPLLVVGLISLAAASGVRRTVIHAV